MEYYFSIYVSFQDFKPYYQGIVDKVEVVDTQGRVLWISGRHFRNFVTENGLRGNFKLVLDGSGKFISLTQV